MSDQPSAAAGTPGLLARDYWLILSTPVPGTSRAAIEAQVPAHIAWLLTLERDGALFLSGRCCPAPALAPGPG